MSKKGHDMKPSASHAQASEQVDAALKLLDGQAAALKLLRSNFKDSDASELLLYIQKE